MMCIDSVLGVMNVLIEAPDNLYFPLLLERSTSGILSDLSSETNDWYAEQCGNTESCMTGL